MRRCEDICTSTVALVVLVRPALRAEFGPLQCRGSLGIVAPQQVHLLENVKLQARVGL